MTDSNSVIARMRAQLRLEAPSLKSRDPARDRAVKARGAACLLAAGSTLAAVPAVAGVSGASPPALAAVAAGGYLLAGLVLLGPRRPARPVLAVATITAIALVGAAVRFGGEAGPVLAVFYLWIALYAAYFHSAGWLAVQLALIAGGSALALLGGGAPLASWIVTTGAVVATAALFRVVRDRVYVLLALLAEAARTDPLTGLLNRRAIEERLEAELARSARSGQPLSVLTADLDDFKGLNDVLGHRAGDEALEQIARRLTEAARRSDAIARVGGDEFALVLPETYRHEANALGERIAARVSATPVAGGVTVRASLGVATLPEDGTTLDELLRVADGMLYAVKGRPISESRRLRVAAED